MLVAPLVWCLLPRPPPDDTIALTIPMQMVVEGAQRDVVLEIERGADVELEVNAFALSWQLGDDQRRALKDAVHADIVRKRVVVPHVVSIAVGCEQEPLARSEISVVVGDGCERPRNATSLGEIISAVLPKRAVITISCDAYVDVFQKVRIDYAYEASQVVLTPTALIFDSKAFRDWWSDHDTFLENARLHQALHKVQYIPPLSVGQNPLDQELSCHEDCPPNFLVLTVEQGHTDTSTAGTFADISASVADGLRKLGMIVREDTCRTFESLSAPFDDDLFVVVLGAHNLQAYVDVATGLPIVLLDDNKMLSKSVLFNFEYIPDDILPPVEQNEGSSLINSKGSFASGTMLEILRRASVVWDYSESNVATLERVGIVDPILVPLGFSESWRSRIDTVDEESIDVLFYGTLTPHRAETLRKLRSENKFRVFHANAASNGVFGDSLDALFLSARIVLNLRAFGDASEWKMPRLARLLANERFVISEGTCGAMSQCDYFKDGVVFVEPDELKATILYYLDRPEERAEIARLGRELFESQPQANFLRNPVEQLLKVKNFTLPDHLSHQREGGQGHLVDDASV